MDAADLKSYSRAFQHIIEECGFAGSWHWSFASGEQRWSPGFRRLLGVGPDPAARYDLFIDLVHPDDRERLPSPSEIRHGGVAPYDTVRLIRPSGEMRTLSLASELRLSPEGRPLAANGVALDITDGERLRRMQAAEQQQRHALYLTSYTATYSLGPDLVHDFPAQVAQAHGLTMEEIRIDPFLMVVPGERDALRNRGWEMYDNHSRFQATAHERLVGGEVLRFRLVGVPVWSGAGAYRGWTGMKYPIGPSGVSVRGRDVAREPGLRLALEQAVRGRHLRAARGLLDWSMATLAAAGGLSLSTVRRLEDDAEGQGSRSRHKAVAALRGAGIRFIALDDGTLAVARC